MRLSLLLGAIFSTPLLLAQPLKVSVSAASAILMNAETGAVLYQKEATSPHYPASITKIGTALYALEKGGNLEERVIITDEMIKTVSPQLKRTGKYPSYVLEQGGTHIGLKLGENVSLKTLFYGLMLSSGNDAANAIASHVSGSVPAFMGELSRYFQEKGLQNTHFHNPHGLHDPRHQTTAFDMAHMTKEALKNPTFCEIVKTIRYVRPETSKQPESLFVQTNRLLKAGTFYYPKAVGVKTGYTSQAGHNLVAAAKDKGRTLIAVLLKCPQNGDKYKDAIALFDAAFAELPVARTFFTKEHDVFSLELKGAQKPLEAVLEEDVTLSYYPAEEPECSPNLIWHELTLPIYKGQTVGELQLKNKEGYILKKTPLYAEEDVQMTFWRRVGESLRKITPVEGKALQGVGFIFLAVLWLGGAFFLMRRKRS